MNQKDLNRVQDFLLKDQQRIVGGSKPFGREFLLPLRDFSGIRQHLAHLKMGELRRIVEEFRIVKPGRTKAQVIDRIINSRDAFITIRLTKITGITGAMMKRSPFTDLLLK